MEWKIVEGSSRANRSEGFLISRFLIGSKFRTHFLWKRFNWRENSQMEKLRDFGWKENCENNERNFLYQSPELKGDYSVKASLRQNFLSKHDRWKISQEIPLKRWTEKKSLSWWLLMVEFIFGFFWWPLLLIFIWKSFYIKLITVRRFIQDEVTFTNKNSTLIFRFLLNFLTWWHFIGRRWYV